MMKMQMASSPFGFLLTAAFLVFGNERLSAQGSTGKMAPPRSQVTLLRISKLPDSAGAIIVRKAGDGGSFVLVDSETRPADLDKAMSALIRSLNNRPTADQEMRAIVQHATPEASQAGANRADSKRAAADLQRLSRTPDPDVDIPGVGKGKAISVKVKLAAK
jgi:hypothetical protein